MRAAEDEQQIREPVDIGAGRRIDEFRLRQPEQRTLDAPAQRARLVDAGDRRRSAGKDEFLQTAEIRAELVGAAFEAGDIVFADQLLARLAKLGADVEKVVLHREQYLLQRAVFELAQDETDARVQFVDLTHAMHARIVLDAPRAVGEPGRAVVTGTRIYSGQAITHYSNL